MSSCEAELVALADTAIELLHIIEVVNFLGHETPDAIEACTDSKAAYDLCHRFTSAQNSRHRVTSIVQIASCSRCVSCVALGVSR